MKRKLKNGLSYLLVILTLFMCVSVSLPSAEAKTDTQRNIFFFLKNNLGLNTAGACGIMANIERESSFNPNLTGDSGTSYGICQWHNKRFTSLKNFCNENGYDWKTLSGQLYYLKYEMEKSYPNTLESIKSVPNTEQGAYDAAFSFCYNFEVPANRTASSEKRGELATSVYWPRYGFAQETKAPTLKLKSDVTSVSSKNSFLLYWSTGKGTFTNYKLSVVRCIDGTVGYDWDGMKTYTTKADTKNQTINPAELSSGNYVAYVYGYDKSTGDRTDYSKFLSFSVYDEMIYEAEAPVADAVYDASVTENVTVKGWAVNTGKMPVSFSYQLDGGNIIPLEAVSRDDVYSQYKTYCVSDEVGYSVKLPTRDISNGEHTLTVYADSKSLSGVLSTVRFTVENSHYHSFTSYISDNNATYTANGTKTAKCDLCRTTHTVEMANTKLKLTNTKKLTAAVSETTAALKWEKVPGATGYKVYVYDTKWISAGTTQELTFNVSGLTPAKSYRFAVKSYAEEDGVSAQASGYTEVSGYTRPAEVTKLKATPSDKSVTLSWAESKGARGYRIFRYVPSTKNWEIVVRSTRNLKATVKELKPNKKYIFAVRPYINTGNEIIWSESYTKITVITKLQTPSARVASTAKGRATVAWNNISGETGYQVWYSTDPDTGYKKIANYKADTVKIYKTGLKSGRTYYFKVRAYKKTSDGHSYSDLSSYKALKIK